MTNLLRLAERAADAAGALLLQRFGTAASGVQSKRTATDLVSDADRDAEDLIIRMIKAERSNDAILGEETGEAGDGALRWVIDPLDGTVNFLHGISQWCVSIAVEDERGALAGVVYDPGRTEMFTAARGEGAFLNGVPIRCSTKNEVSTSIVATGFSYVSEEREQWGAHIARLLPQVADIRRAGSAALDLAWCAAGRVDIYAEVPVARWDRAAGVLIAQEAGCMTEDLPALGASGPGLLVGPPGLFTAARALVQ